MSNLIETTRGLFGKKMTPENQNPNKNAATAGQEVPQQRSAEVEQKIAQVQERRQQRQQQARAGRTIGGTLGG
jgi:hypothetical protein